MGYTNIWEDENDTDLINITKALYDSKKSLSIRDLADKTYLPSIKEAVKNSGNTIIINIIERKLSILEGASYLKKEERFYSLTKKGSKAFEFYIIDNLYKKEENYKVSKNKSIDNGKVVKLVKLSNSIDSKTNLTTNLTNLTKWFTISTNLTKLTNLTTQDKILIEFILPNTLNSIADKLSISIQSISVNIQRKDRGTGLLYDNYIEPIEKEGNVTKYVITQKGIDYLKSIYDAHMEKNAREMQKEDNKLKIEEKLDDWGKFFQKYYNSIIDFDKRHTSSITIDFNELMHFNPKLANELLDNPEEIIKLAELEFEKLHKNFKIRFKNLPKTEERSIAEIRYGEIGKFIKVIGTVVSLSKVKPHLSCAKFECPSCGNMVTLLQQNKNFKEPTKCGCGRKGKFILMDKEFKSGQFIKLEELSEHMSGRTQQQTIMVVLSYDLTHIENQPFFEKSEPIIINGIIKDIQIESKGFKSNIFELVLEANSIEFDKNIKKINLTTKIKEECKELASKPDVEDILVKSFAQDIFDKENEKKALIYSLVSGGDETVKFRDDSHILMIGDAGVGKSSLAIECQKLSVGCRWISGKGSTGAGLIGTVSKDNDFNGEIVLQKGALPMANQSVCICDELDKMGENNTDALHEALENQKCSIDKWNKHQQFRTDCTFIGAANPVHGKFDLQSPLVEQIALPKPLIDRFDLIIPFIDTVSKDDMKLAEKIGDKFQGKNIKEEAVEFELLRNYLFYARLFKPVPTDSALKEINKYWVSLRAASLNSDSNMAISARHLHGLNRLARSSAKLRLKNVVNKSDAINAIKIYDYFIKKMGLEIVGYEIQEESISDEK